MLSFTSADALGAPAESSAAIPAAASIGAASLNLSIADSSLSRDRDR